MRPSSMTPAHARAARLAYVVIILVATLSNLYPDGDQVRVRFYEKAKSIAPGQSAVFYEGGEVIDGGIIQRGEPQEAK